MILLSFGTSLFCRLLFVRLFTMIKVCIFKRNSIAACRNITRGTSDIRVEKLDAIGQAKTFLLRSLYFSATIFMYYILIHPDSGLLAVENFVVIKSEACDCLSAPRRPGNARTHTHLSNRTSQCYVEHEIVTGLGWRKKVLTRSSCPIFGRIHHHLSFFFDKLKKGFNNIKR